MKMETTWALLLRSSQLLFSHETLIVCKVLCMLGTVQETE